VNILNDESKVRLLQSACCASLNKTRRLFGLFEGRRPSWNIVVRIAQEKGYKELDQYLRICSAHSNFKP